MKKWIKRNSKWLLTGLSMLFIANAAYGLITTRSELYFVLHFVCISIWLITLSLVLGIFNKIYDWWEKDQPFPSTAVRFAKDEK